MTRKHFTLFDVINIRIIFVLLLVIIQVSTNINQASAQKFYREGLLENYSKTSNFLDFKPTCPIKIKGTRILEELLILPNEFKKYYNVKDSSFRFDGKINLTLEDCLSQPVYVDPHYVGQEKTDIFYKYVNGIDIKAAKIRFPIMFSNIVCPPENNPFVGGFTLRDSFLDSVSFWGIKANIKLSQNKIDGDLEFHYVKSVVLENNQFLNHHKISIKESTPSVVIIKQDKIDLESEGNWYKSIEINTKARSGGTISFLRDRFSESFSLNGIVGKDTKLDKPISLSFEGCHFHKKSGIYLRNISKLSLINCELDSVTQITRDSDSDEKMQFELYNISSKNLDFLDFEVWDNIELCFPKYARSDQIQKNYLSLLAKFEKEQRRQSYKYVDIQYQNFLWNRYLYIGPSLSFIDKWWWNYGYDKGRIFIWCFFFLTIFYSTNLILGKKLLAFYPILNEEDLKDVRQQNRSKINRFVVMFILTVYIFFSLRVDLSKLKISHTGMLMYFFIQYFTGLICLLFLFGAILKF